ncbi:PAS domain-containing sensor histidine kinase [Candidatus Saccharibacteria bacterium]|nr:PAS domain-containing sensor histidine kinase [Candidatus Saccharibacteria bacterium]MDQ5954012.1 hypothetical protein [Patescibacteria group bacterium]MDQ5958335.1 hypothetical protein [Patescibacteria group bacterium]
MITYLQPLRESIWLKIILVTLFSLLSGVIAYVILTKYITVSPYVAACSSLAITFIVSVIISKRVADQAMASTNLLVRALIIGLDDSPEIEKPDAKDIIKPSREYLIKLAERAMDINVAIKSTNQAGLSKMHFYQAVADSIAVPIIVVSSKQIITYANNAAIKYLELSPEKIIGQYFYDACNLSFVGGSTLESWLESAKDGSNKQNEIWERVRLNLAEDKRKQFDLAAHYIKDSDKDIELTLAFFDRTLHYERDDHDLSFVSLAVHELRTPLTIMRGYIEVFEDELTESLNSEQTEFMHNMSASAQQLAAFVSSILNVARIEENALYLHLKEENIKKVLEEACKNMQLRARVHDKNIVVNIDDNLPTVGIDKVSIFEVMNNLIDNAIKYTHTKEDITVKTTLKDGMIETTVSDNGIGIASNVIGHVFDKFYRAHKSKNSIGGTGLGLYLSKAIIDAHGGTIWVKSKEDQGSTFGFTVPIYSDIASQIKDSQNKEIVRGAHGWIKNHTLYRG